MVICLRAPALSATDTANAILVVETRVAPNGDGGRVAVASMCAERMHLAVVVAPLRWVPPLVVLLAVPPTLPLWLTSRDPLPVALALQVAAALVPG